MTYDEFKDMKARAEAELAHIRKAAREKVAYDRILAAIFGGTA